MTARKITNLEQMLDGIERATDGDEVSVAEIVRSVGRRSFGPLLLLAGIVMVSPLSGIPGMPTMMGVFVALIAWQLVLRRECCWLPAWLLGRSMERGKVAKALHWLRRPARVVDRWLRPRLANFTGPLARYATAIVCALIAVAMPVMEFVPLSATGAGIALSAFGLSLIANDGLLALAAHSIVGVTVAFVLHRFI